MVEWKVVIARHTLGEWKVWTVARQTHVVHETFNLWWSIKDFDIFFYMAHRTRGKALSPAFHASIWEGPVKRKQERKKNWPANAPHQEAGRSIRLEFSYSFRSLTCVLAERELHVQQPVVSPNHGRRVCVTHNMLTNQCYLKLFNESYLMIFSKNSVCCL